MAIDGIFIHHLIKEIKGEIKGCRIEKITYANQVFCFSIYANKKRKFLHFDLSATNCSFYLSEHDLINQPSAFLTTLKNQLEGAIIDDIQQIKTDRIVIFDLRYYDFILGPVKKELIFELMGKHANLFLVQDGKIIDCYKKSFSIDGRHLVPNAEFVHFYSDKKDAGDYMYDPLDGSFDIMNKYLGISKDLAIYLHNNPVKPLEIAVIPSRFKSGKIYFNPLNSNEFEALDSLNSLLENKLLPLIDHKKKYRTYINQSIKKSSARLQTLQKQKLENLDFQKYQDMGNAIYASGYDLSLKRSQLDQIELNPLKTLNQNAQDLFKKYQKLKRSIAHLDEQIKRQETILESLADLLVDLDLTQDKDLKQFDELLVPFGYKATIPKTKKPTKPKILTISGDDAIYYIGKNAIQNRYLVFEYANKSDYWFHVKDGGGAHIVVKTDELSEKVIRKAAMLAAYFSPHKLSSSVAVNYTKVQFLAKISKISTFLVKIRNEKTIFIDIDQKQIDQWLKSI